MANVKNLATAEDKFKQLSIAHDMTKKERLQNREKLAEAKNKNEYTLFLPSLVTFFTVCLFVPVILQSSFTSAISSAFLCSGSVFFDPSALNRNSKTNEGHF
jgi:hypothetical protein